MTQAAFFDVVGTVVAGNPWMHVFEHPRVSRLRVQLAYVPITFWWWMKKLHIVDDTRFRHHWLWAVVGIFKGWKRDEMQQVFADVVRASRTNGDIFSDTLERIAWHKTQGHRVVLVTGLFDLFADEYAKAVGADAAIGSPLAFDSDGVCLGRMRGSTIGGLTKLDAMHGYLEREGLNTDLRAHYAYADSYSDVPMLSAVGQPCAVHPEVELAEFAEAHGWPILGSLAK